MNRFMVDIETLDTAPTAVVLSLGNRCSQRSGLPISTIAMPGKHFDPKMPTAPGIQWLTTEPNPRSSAKGYDAGQRGWRLHAVRANDSDGFKAVAQRPALCGLVPRHGWGLDLFIVRTCVRCAAKVVADTMWKNDAT